jgi:hypothetical protein
MIMKENYSLQNNILGIAEMEKNFFTNNAYMILNKSKY